MTPFLCRGIHADDRPNPQGLASFTKLAAELAYGKNSKPLVEDRVGVVACCHFLLRRRRHYLPPFLRLCPRCCRRSHRRFCWDCVSVERPQLNSAARHHPVHLRHRRPPHRHRLPRALLPRRQGHLPPLPDMGQPHPHRQGLGSRGEAVQVGTGSVVRTGDGSCCRWSRVIGSRPLRRGGGDASALVEVRYTDGRRYFNKETVGLDFEGMKADIKVGSGATDRESCSV
jgi:hypothetical protein